MLSFHTLELIAPTNNAVRPHAPVPGSGLVIRHSSVIALVFLITLILVRLRTIFPTHYLPLRLLLHGTSPISILAY
jgi:hypothetical protein